MEKMREFSFYAKNVQIQITWCSHRCTKHDDVFHKPIHAREPPKSYIYFLPGASPINSFLARLLIADRREIQESWQNTLAALSCLRLLHAEYDIGLYLIARNRRGEGVEVLCLGNLSGIKGVQEGRVSSVGTYLSMDRNWIVFRRSWINHFESIHFEDYFYFGGVINYWWRD